ncbi:hypothetical protein JZU71_05630 [bacterium]|nr:hypothetical protein [bacterium]
MPAHSGNNLVFFNSFDAFTGSSATLTSPSFSLSTGSTNNTVSFWMYRDATTYTDEGATNDDKVELYINTAANLSGATILGSVYRLTSLSPSVASEGWYYYTFPIPDTFNTSSNYLILKSISGWGNDIHLDDIRSDVRNSCLLAKKHHITRLNFCRMVRL